MENEIINEVVETTDLTDFAEQMYVKGVVHGSLVTFGSLLSAHVLWTYAMPAVVKGWRSLARKKGEKKLKLKVLRNEVDENDGEDLNLVEEE
jgi:hypothetical protein